MSLENVHLRKLLKIMFLPANGRTSALRNDIREEIARQDSDSSGGGDFYAPFWRDAKEHVFGRADLHDLVDQRIQLNFRRANLYPLLRDGFLEWWNERRRWNNAPFTPGQNYKGRYPFLSLNSAVKVDNIMAVRDGRNVEHYIYPYFSPEPVLSEQAARLGLWLLTRALPSLGAGELRILDVMRSQTYSVDRNPLSGNEEADFIARYQSLLVEWRRLWGEYG